jgi:PAS domain S-box-containing protein
MSKLVLPDTEMGRLFRTTDWSATPLGPTASWSPDLVSAVNMALASRFPMLICWGDDLLKLYNDAYRAILGSEKHPDALGRPVADVWPEVWHVIGPRFEEVLRTREPSWDEDQLLVVDRNGFVEEAYFTWSYSVMTGADGEVVGILDVATETTGKVLAERRARVVAALGAALADAETPEDVERIAVEILGRNHEDHTSVVLDLEPTASEVVPAPWSPGTPPLLGDDGIHVVAALDTGRDVPSAALVLTANPMRPWDDHLQAYVEQCAAHVAAALSGVRRLDDERQRAAALAELDTAKTAFFANISHELRTPLTLISGPVNDALAEGDLPEGVRRHLELVRRNTARLRLLVDRLLDLTRLDAGRVHPHLAEVDVAELVRGLAASFRPAMERAGLRFETDVPDLSRTAWVDPDMTERIVLNLLSNALKYTPEGGVELALHERPDGVEVVVTDSGVGIAAGDVGSVFDRFQQLPRRPGVRSDGGAGIGLFLVRQLAELHGGHAWVDSVEGTGSSFGVVLPWGEQPAPDTLPSGDSITPRRVDSFVAEVHDWNPDADLLPGRDGDEEGDAEATPTAGELAGRPLLLVVDDNADMRAYVASALENAYEVVQARNGFEALDLARERRPDLVLADVMMPGLDGLGLVRELRADPALSDVTVVLLTARAGAEASVASVAEGADDYITKPFEMRHLQVRLAANLARSRERARDVAWRRAVLASLHEPLIIIAMDGDVVAVNDAFTEAYGWSVDDVPLAPPYPWRPDGLDESRVRLQRILATQGTHEETFALTRRDGGTSWVSLTASVIPANGLHPALVVGVARDITAQRRAQARRARAASLAAELTGAQELEQVLAAAVAGFSVLFHGTATLRVPSEVAGRDLFFTPSGPVAADALDPWARAALVRGDVPDELPDTLAAGGPGDGSRATSGAAPDGPSPRAKETSRGILLTPAGSESGSRVWVRFRTPRAVPVDERIAGDLIAQLFAQAVDRVADRHDREVKEAQLRQAIDSHRLIGHAVGVLIERHRVTAVQGFEMLRQASLNRNIKLREIASRVIETGLDPGEA